jgi:hypothetical protein
MPATDGLVEARDYDCFSDLRRKQFDGAQLSVTVSPLAGTTLPERTIALNASW